MGQDRIPLRRSQRSLPVYVSPITRRLGQLVSPKEVLVYTILRRPSAVAVLALAPVLLAGCGESSQAKAKAQVCSARTEIAAQVAKLEGLSISASLLTDATASVEAIDRSVTRINDAEPKLEPAVKQQVEAGTKSFQAEMAVVGGGLALAAKVPGGIQTALKSVGPEIKAALTQLSASYKQAYASLKC